jgi:translocation and assembly module TamB
MDDETAINMPDRKASWVRWTYLIFGLVFFLIIGLLAFAYWQRLTLADRFVRDQLEQYGVRASYKIKDIGLRTQRLEDVVIGDPSNPDLTIKSAEIDVSLNFSGAKLRDVRASGIRLRGRYDGKQAYFGELDKFRDPKNKDPFELPDIGLKVSDAAVFFATPWGDLDANLDGSGLLRQRFAGRLDLKSAALSYANCTMNQARFNGGYILDSRRPNLVGPMTADSVSCPKSGLSLTKANLETDVRLSESFDRWFGNVNYTAKALKTKSFAFNLPRGNVQFDGSKERTNFETQLAGAEYKSVPLSVRNVQVSAKGRIENDGEGVAVAARGDISLAGSALDKSYASRADSFTARAKDTPVGPLLAKIGPAIRQAAANFDGQLRYDASIEPDSKSTLILDAMRLITKSGVRISQNGVLQLRGNKAGWTLTSPVNIALSGGGLPTGKLALKKGKGTAWSGSLALNEYRANGASLAISKLDFSGRPGGAWDFDGRALLTGPLRNGYVKALNLPIDARWDGRNLALYQSCQTLSFDGVKYSDIVLTKQNVTLCPNSGGQILQTGGGGLRFAASAPSFAFNGSYAGQPVKAKTGNIRFNLDNGFVAQNVDAYYGRAPIHVRTPILNFGYGKGFSSAKVNVEIGSSKSKSVFDIANVKGRFTKNGLSGTLDGANGRIANVPLLLDNILGEWSYRGGALALNGSMMVSDAEQVDRFLPMNVPDAKLELKGGVINAFGSLYEPTLNRKVAVADIVHRLNAGEGGAQFTVQDLLFNEQFEPELLTPLVVGAIANTRGTFNGKGRIDWSPSGVTSGGTFVTESLNVAAAFGPVEGLRTEITFSDLLSLETGPGQVAQIGSVNPGIAALNGQIKYQLLPGKKLGIEGGEWPFAGGVLRLEPTVLDFGVDKERRLTFKVEGIDSALFLQQYDFQNIQVSGVFDGTLPMVFNQQGGRIEGGTLISRTGGGELSYLGDLSYKDMGVFANYAFQALRSIRYNELTIDIEGDLGGEIITQVSFSGVQQGAGAKRNFITKQLAKLPIQFNVRISAQFLQLIGSIRGIYDQQYASERYLPLVIEKTQAVKSKQSETENEQKDE